MSRPGPDLFDLGDEIKVFIQGTSLDPAHSTISKSSSSFNLASHVRNPYHNYPCRHKIHPPLPVRQLLGRAHRASAALPAVRAVHEAQCERHTKLKMSRFGGFRHGLQTRVGLILQTLASWEKIKESKQNKSSEHSFQRSCGNSLSYITPKPKVLTYNSVVPPGRTSWQAAALQLEL